MELLKLFAVVLLGSMLGSFLVGFTKPAIQALATRYAYLRRVKLVTIAFRKVRLLYWVKGSGNTIGRQYRLTLFRWDLPSYRYALRKDQKRQHHFYANFGYRPIFDRWTGKRTPEPTYSGPNTERWRAEEEKEDSKYYRFPNV